MGWPAFVLFVVNLAISYYMRPDVSGPGDASAAGIKGVEAPTAEEGTPVPVIFGRVHVQSPNVVWYGDLQSKPIRKSTGSKK